MTGGCGTLVGLEDGYYLHEGAGGGSGPGEGGGAGSGGDCTGGACAAPPRCDGLGKTCGPDGDESCCVSLEVDGGAFKRDNDERYPARVSAFSLDRFEVTVGRFRRFVEAYPGSKPRAGAGKHPLIDGSGWDDGWDSWLPANAAALKEAVKCEQSLQATYYRSYDDPANSGNDAGARCARDR
ncbi:hypothetical protein WMF38_27375 [Sorangium sp. So ce118]